MVNKLVVDLPLGSVPATSFRGVWEGEERGLAGLYDDASPVPGVRAVGLWGTRSRQDRGVDATGAAGWDRRESWARNHITLLRSQVELVGLDRGGDRRGTHRTCSVLQSTSQHLGS